MLFDFKYQTFTVRALYETTTDFPPCQGYCPERYWSRNRYRNTDTWLVRTSFPCSNLEQKKFGLTVFKHSEFRAKSD